MRDKVVIRTDGNGVIGLGHVIRCQALGQMLRHSFDILFVFKEITDSVLAEFVRLDFLFKKIDQEDDIIQHISKNDTVVFDGYQFTAIHHQRVKDFGCKVVCIDDIHHQHFNVDMIINHAPGITRERYSAEKDTRFLLGPEYALLRPAFLEAANRTRGISKIESAVICFGGADSNNLSGQVLQAVAQLNTFKQITLITGKAYTHHAALAETLGRIKSSTVRHLQGLSEAEMLAEFMTHELAIVPASSVLFEALAAQCVVISGYYIDNQKDMYAGFVKENAIIGCTDFNISALTNALHSLSDYNIQSKANRIIDGLSGNRIRDAFKALREPELTFRLATQADSKQYFDWANEAEVRANSRNTGMINWESHQEWFSNKLNNYDRNRLYIFFSDGEAVGQIRFELKSDEWIINYSIDKNFRGRGFAPRMLRMVISELRRDSALRITAFIKEDNMKSISVFQRLNFEFDKSQDGLVYYFLN